MYKDHAESKKQEHFKVLRDTLQYLQRWKDSELWLQPRSYEIQNKNHFTIKSKSKILQERWKGKIDARFEPATQGLQFYPSIDWATRKVTKYSTKNT